MQYYPDDHYGTQDSRMDALKNNVRSLADSELTAETGIHDRRRAEQEWLRLNDPRGGRRRGESRTQGPDHRRASRLRILS